MNGARLAQLRLAKGWSQQRLATEAGIHVMTVSAMEREAKEPLLNTVEAVARALGITVDDLLGEPAPEDGMAGAAAPVGQGDPDAPAGTPTAAAPASQSARRSA